MYPNVCGREPYEYVTLCSIAMYRARGIFSNGSLGGGVRTDASALCFNWLQKWHAPAQYRRAGGTLPRGVKCLCECECGRRCGTSWRMK